MIATNKCQSCRYCGHVAYNHDRETTSQWTMPKYSCRDVRACGDRIRGGKPAPTILPGETPF